MSSVVFLENTKREWETFNVVSVFPWTAELMVLSKTENNALTPDKSFDNETSS